ncbi:hypothetical protein PFFCH_02757 [Plasmodium falciparum FCH/4]|uniref:Uncharacterized protein n=1 Tax=Plasmodium falciparum FCH/4 TaxID=1036724 RepID=A0A024VNJ8_PLAFA|nr:hypothetical protein PFFCH_02757 [Plasmodium falciparum FCH/4]
MVKINKIKCSDEEIYLYIYIYNKELYINIVKNTKEEKYINNLKNKIEKNKISIPQKANDSLSYVLILSDFNKCKREILDCLDNEFVNHNKLDKIEANTVLVTELKESVMGGALGLCYVENMIYLCGCYTNSSAGHENYFVLVGIEMIKKKLRIVCKSNNPTLSSAILFLIVLMHKKHET